MEVSHKTTQGELTYRESWLDYGRIGNNVDPDASE
jgi:hypothetical protein